MRKLTFTPAACLPSTKKETAEDGTEREVTVPPAYSGTVTIKVPTNLERMDLLEGFDADDVKDEKKAAKAMRGLVKLSIDWILAVDLKRLEDDFPITSYEDLSYESALSTLQIEIANRLIGKHKVTGADAETGEQKVVAGTLGN